MVIIKELRVLSLFSGGAGAFELALGRQYIPFELVNFCEIDKYAIKSYCAIHNVNESLNLGDVSQVDFTNISDVDLIVGGSPCQDFSISGKGNGAMWTCLDCGKQYNPIQQHHSQRQYCIKCGGKKLEKTRSSLFVEYLRSIKEVKPNYFVYENVKNIIGKKNKETFDLFEKELREYGYNIYWKVLNAKDYGVPQNRERIFVVGIRKDIDDKTFEFPQGFDKGVRLKDILEDEVDEKFYLSAEQCEKFIQNINLVNNNANNAILKLGNINPSGRGMNGVVYHEEGLSPTITTNKGEGSKILVKDLNPNEIDVVGKLDIKGQDIIKRVYNKEGISPTLTTMEGGNRQPKVLEPKTITRIIKDNVCGIIRTIDTGGDKRIIEPQSNGFRIRKLTPLECWRLMGFDDQDFYKAQATGNSNTQLYKQAGNSIVVDVLEYIFKNLFKNCQLEI